MAATATPSAAKASAGRKSAKSAARAEAASDASFSDYLTDSRRPLTCLLAILPLVAFYEVGILWVTQANPQHPPTHILAFVMLREALANLGATGRWLPAIALLGTLMSSHIIRGDPWRVRRETLAGMFAEGVSWSLPILALGLAVSWLFPLAAAESDNQPEGLFYWIVLSVGAGVYEELAFRVLAFAALGLLLLDGLRMSPAWATRATVVLSAVGFSIYHYWGSEAFHAQTFVFRTGAGIFFGILYLNRGIGITIATHAIYDVLLQILRHGVA